jgi:hypothetical protein
VLVGAGIAVFVLLGTLGITTTRQALGPGRQWYEYLLPTGFALLAILVLVLVVR